MSLRSARELTNSKQTGTGFVFSFIPYYIEQIASKTNTHLTADNIEQYLYDELNTYANQSSIDVYGFLNDDQTRFDFKNPLFVLNENTAMVLKMKYDTLTFVAFSVDNFLRGL